MQRRPNADEFLTRDTRAVRPVQNPFAKLHRGSHVCGASAATRNSPAVAARRLRPEILWPIIAGLWLLAVTVSQGSSAKFIYFDF